MSQELQIVAPSGSLAAPQKTLFNQGPRDMVAFATEVANVLKDVIGQQNLFTMIQGKPHVKVEGWTTMGTILGILPREREVKELADGSYEAHVDLVRQSDGCIVGGASSLCSVDESRWGKADKYARRSMAITRATGKAYRLGFSWIMSLAGYEPTPLEEMPFIEAETTKPDRSIFTALPDQAKVLKAILTESKIPEDHWQACGKHLVNSKTKMSNLTMAVRSFKDEHLNKGV